MYNSAIKGKSHLVKYDKHEEIPHKIFYNDLTKNWYIDDFNGVDCIYSEPSWKKGYDLFNKRAENEKCGTWVEYVKNINRLIHTLNIPSFIICGKSFGKYFTNCKSYEILFKHENYNVGKSVVYVWNYDDYGNIHIKDTEELVMELSKKYKKVLDFSCGYGEHLLKFNDFIGCDIDRNALTYLCIKYREKKNAN